MCDDIGMASNICPNILEAQAAPGTDHSWNILPRIYSKRSSGLLSDGCTFIQVSREPLLLRAHFSDDIRLSILYIHSDALHSFLSNYTSA